MLKKGSKIIICLNYRERNDNERKSILFLYKLLSLGSFKKLFIGDPYNKVTGGLSVRTEGFR